MNIILSIAAFMFLLLFIAQVFSGNRRIFSNRIFILFLLLNSILMTGAVLYNYNLLIPENAPRIFFIIMALYYANGPIIYIYFKSLKSGFGIKYSDLLHFSPVIVIGIILISDYSHRLSPGTFPITALTKIGAYYYYGLLNLQLAIYLLFSLFSIIEYSKNKTQTMRRNWLLFTWAIFCTHWILDMFQPVNFLLINLPIIYSEIVESISISMLLFFSVAVVFKSLEKFDPVDYVFVKNKYASSSLTREDKLYIKNKIKLYMENKKPYLDPDFSITKMSDHLRIPTRYLSQALNEIYKLNFYHFVNSYRIQDAQERLLQEESHQNGNTILKIIYDSGFNSKSAFNRAFKKHTGLTPSEFRKNHLVA